MENEVRERALAMGRKKGDSRFAEEQAETVRQEREHEGMRVNDERELRRQRAIDAMEEIVLACFPEE